MTDSLEKIAKDISRCGCDFPTDGTYDEQVESSGFVRLLMYNCILFDRLYSCAKNGACKTCKAYTAICAAEKKGGKIAMEIGFWRELLRPSCGMERDSHYYEIASRRVNDAKPTPPTTTQEELPL